MKTGPKQDKEVKIVMASTTGDPNIEFDFIQEAEEYLTLNFEDTNDPNSAPGPSTNASYIPKSPIQIQKLIQLNVRFQI